MKVEYLKNKIELDHGISILYDCDLEKVTKTLKEYLSSKTPANKGEPILSYKYIDHFNTNDKQTQLHFLDT